MKKWICALLSFALLCSGALAEICYVTITDGDGQFCLAYTATEVSDVDGDGTLTAYDALYCAHEQYYEGGAEAGFAAEDQGYGPSLTKLWGIDNGGSFGYYVDNISCTNLADPVSDQSHVQAYAYQDLENWSDTYSYFEVAAADETATTLTLIMQGHDADWNVVEAPVAGAKITINGEDTGLVTDDNGSVTLECTEPGSYTVSATYDAAVLVPPIYVMWVSD